MVLLATKQIRLKLLTISIVFLISQASAQEYHNSDVRAIINFMVDSVVSKQIAKTHSLRVWFRTDNSMAFDQSCFDFQFKKTVLSQVDQVEFSRKLKLRKNILLNSKNTDAAHARVDTTRIDRYEYASNLIVFSTPIFLRRSSICVIGYSNVASGGGAFVLRKVKRKWEVAERLCDWYF